MLKVLVWGSSNVGPCAFFRGGQLFDTEWRRLGIEVCYVSELDCDVNRILDRSGAVIDTAKVAPSELLAMLDSGNARLDYHLDASALDWADVLYFRRYYRVSGRDLITRAVWDVVESMHDGPAVMYDCDDDLLGPAPRWNGLADDMDAAQPLVRRMAKRADLVTVSTPVLARHFEPLNPNVRVIRNAIDAAMYIPTEPRPEGDKARVTYYGNASRMRDYEGYPDLSGKWQGGYPKAAVRDHARSVRTVFLGAENGQPRGFDETRPYVRGIPEFARVLANTHGDVGLAPVFGDSFDQCKSELHWLEYSAAGMATIATRYNGGPDAGPYNIIRDGVDGVLAKGRQEWSDGLRRLLDPAFRADVAAAARERIAAEYSHVKRAEEWANAFRWAADHAGSRMART